MSFALSGRRRVHFNHALGLTANFCAHRLLLPQPDKRENLVLALDMPKNQHNAMPAQISHLLQVSSV